MGKGLCNKPSINDQLPPVANVKADFVMGTDVPAFLEQLLSYPDVDTARQVLETFDADAKSCTTYNQDGVAFTVGQLSFPSMGDQSVAYRINVSQSGVSVTADTAVVRKDAVVLYAAYFDFATDTAEAVALTTQAYDKMVQTLHLGENEGRTHHDQDLRHQRQERGADYALATWTVHRSQAGNGGR